MADVLVEFSEPIAGADGVTYHAKACGAEMEGGLWAGWIEFTPAAGGAVLRSGRETTQPNRGDAEYWATGLTPVYLEGALARALKGPAAQRVPPSPTRPAYDEPAPDFIPGAPPPNGVLNPFSVYRKGEPLLRAQLRALSAWHLVNIVRAHALSDLPAERLNEMTQPALIELIVKAIRDRESRIPRR